MSSRAVSAIDHSIAATLSLEGSSSIEGVVPAPASQARARMKERRTISLPILAGGEL